MAMAHLRRVALLALAAYATADEAASTTLEVPPTDGLFFVETFQSGMGAWSLSSAADYAGQPVSLAAADLPAPFDQDKGLLLEKEMKRYGVAAPFASPLDVTDKPFVLQYEVELTGGLTCGGAYLKVLASTDELDVAKLDGETPYVIMFGPDKCGDTNKVHFIFRHQNPVSGAWEEKHLKSPPSPKTDKKAHVYTLVVRPDNEYEIFIDGASQKKGSLLEDFTPPVNPEKEIDDPEDFKPDDWVDVARIADPAAAKPDDWDEDAPKQIDDAAAEKPAGWLDDEPDQVADPEAVRPEDWDDEEDGEWEAPVVANPKCAAGPGCGEWVRPKMANPDFKGKWSAPKIDNPDYKGEWAPRTIENPHWFEDAKPSALANMGALAVEIWTTNGGIKMDNFVVAHDEAAVRAFTAVTFDKKKAAAAAKETADKEAAKDKELEEKRSTGGLANTIEVALNDGVKVAMANPLPAGATVIALLAGLFFVCCGGRRRR